MYRGRVRQQKPPQYVRQSLLESVPLGLQLEVRRQDPLKFCRAKQSYVVVVRALSVLPPGFGWSSTVQRHGCLSDEQLIRFRVCALVPILPEAARVQQKSLWWIVEAAKSIPVSQPAHLFTLFSSTKQEPRHSKGLEPQCSKHAQ
jgi:hypothetical protein